MNKTSIEWCDFAANPIRYRDTEGKSVWACVKASEGCQHCYAEALAHRYQGREFTAKAMEGVTPYVDERELKAMLAPAKLPAGSKVFVGDMTDMFGPWVPFELLDRVFAVFALRPDVVFQVLTKRPERMREYLAARDTAGAVAITIREVAPDGGLAAMKAMGTHVLRDVVQRRWPLPNIWLGVSVENQHWADVRIPELLATPAAVRFLSCEPLLGEVYFTRDLLWNATPCPEGCGCARPVDADVADCACDGPCCFDLEGFNGRKPDIDWVIVGGESGPGARPCDVGWIRSIVSQCKAAGTKVFVKQLGAKPYVRWMETEAHPVYDEGDPGFHEVENLEAWRLRNRKGADPDEWPEDLRVREWPL